LKKDYAARTDSSNTHNVQSRPEKLVQNVIEIVEEKKGHDVVALDVRELTVLTDYFVLASADSETAIRSLANAVIERLAQKGFEKPWHVEGTAAGGWIVIDYADAVVHIFHDRTREFYDLEGLWGDAPRFPGSG